MSIEQRLIELESRLTFQDDGIQALGDLVYAQQQQLDRLQKSIDLLNQRFQEVSAGGTDKIVDEPPPHY
ncbi:MAG: SlyX family protein [Gammaproteobacteria bacterium]